MKTSAAQFQLLVDYMERYGDLSKPTEGPYGRATNLQRWTELTDILNADSTGDTINVEKWRKVWSDLKNNTKRKASRIYRATHGTGGGPASNLKLTDLEERVLSIMGTRAATGMVEIPEIGLQDEVTIPPPEHNDSPSILLHTQDANSTSEPWNMPGTSAAPAQIYLHGEERGVSAHNSENTILDHPSRLRTTASPPQHENGQHVMNQSATDGGAASLTRPQSPTVLPPTPRRRRRGGFQPVSPNQRRTRTQTQSELARQAFARSDAEWRVFQREAERERIRLREAELTIQRRWLDLFGQFLELGNRVVNIFERQN